MPETNDFIRIDHITIPEGPGTDPIHIFAAIHSETSGRTAARITIATYDEAWTCYFGAMQGTWRQFLKGCDAEYLYGAMVQGLGSPRVVFTKRVAQTIINHLRAEPEQDTTTSPSRLLTLADVVANPPKGWDVAWSSREAAHFTHRSGAWLATDTELRDGCERVKGAQARAAAHRDIANLLDVLAEVSDE